MTYKTACEELAHNFFTTAVQYELYKTGIEKLIFNDLMREDPKDAIEFTYHNSTFITDPFFYSPSRKVIADMTDVQDGLLSLASKDKKEHIEDFVLKELNTVLYRGLVLELGVSILREADRKDIINVLLDAKETREIYDMIDKDLRSVARLEKEIYMYIHDALEDWEIDIEKFQDLLD